MELALPRELNEAKRRKIPLCIPVGVMEYHAAHCALGTDVLIPAGLLSRFEKNKEIVIAPPVWYGPSSYSVAGPEKNSIDIDADVFCRYMYCILGALLDGGWTNIYVIMIHQTVGYNPTEIACMNAAKKLIFEYAQKEKGKGWWGRSKDACEDGWPWDLIRVMSVMERHPDKIMPLDHAAFHETSLLWALKPDAVDIARTAENVEWFCESAADATSQHGEELISQILEYWHQVIK